MTTEEAKKILINGLGINEDTYKLHQLKGYKKAIKFVKYWSAYQEFLTFDMGKDGDECIVNIRSCAVC